MTHQISIVTPSYNQGQYLEQTIVSVLGQNTLNLEYIVIDGKSTDNSVDILNQYNDRIAYWSSEPDRGQADAINKGFHKSTGEVLGWLNSDDLYMPGTILHVSSKLNPRKAQIIFGNCLHFNSDNPRLTFGSDLEDRLSKKDFLNGSLIQPSTFWTRKAWELVGQLNIKMHYAFDLEWFNKAKKVGVEFIYTPRHLSLYRIHGEHKTATGGTNRLKEIAKIYGSFKGKEYEDSFLKLIKNKNKISLFINFSEKTNLIKNKKLFNITSKLLFHDSLSKINGDDVFFMIYRLK